MSSSLIVMNGHDGSLTFTGLLTATDMDRISLPDIAKLGKEELMSTKLRVLADIMEQLEVKG